MAQFVPRQAIPRCGEGVGLVESDYEKEKKRQPHVRSDYSPIHSNSVHFTPKQAREPLPCSHPDCRIFARFTSIPILGTIARYYNAQVHVLPISHGTSGANSTTLSPFKWRCSVGDHLIGRFSVQNVGFGCGSGPRVHM
jgi:hypothetical protein